MPDLPSSKKGLSPQTGFAATALDLSAAEPLWDAFTDDDPCGAAQTREWVTAWAACVNAEIVVGVIRLAGQPVLLLPLEIVSVHGARVARYPGGTHANANFPLMSKKAELGNPAPVIDQLMQCLKQHALRPDAVALTRQRTVLAGVANPLLCLSSMESPNLALSFDINSDFEELLKHRSGTRKLKKLRQQARRMDERGGWEAITAKDSAAANALLDAFLAMKAKRFKEFGQKDTFADPRIVSFFRTLFAEAAERPNPSFKLEALKVGGELLAVSGSTIRHGRNTVEFGAVRTNEPTLSPGDFLYHQLIKQACEDGLAAFDFGVGDEPYKRSWCDVETRHMDSVKAFTPRGFAYLAIFKAGAHAKRLIKRNDKLFALVKKWRKRNAPAPEAQD